MIAAIAALVSLAVAVVAAALACLAIVAQHHGAVRLRQLDRRVVNLAHINEDLRAANTVLPHRCVEREAERPPVPRHTDDAPPIDLGGLYRPTRTEASRWWDLVDQFRQPSAPEES